MRIALVILVVAGCNSELGGSGSKGDGPAGDTMQGEPAGSDSNGGDTIATCTTDVPLPWAGGASYYRIQ